jgi:hypothetical protein
MDILKIDTSPASFSPEERADSVVARAISGLQMQKELARMGIKPKRPGLAIILTYWALRFAPDGMWKEFLEWIEGHPRGLLWLRSHRR